MSDWLPTTDETEVEGTVEACAVRNPDGKSGFRIRLLDSNQIEAFDGFYTRIRLERNVHIVEAGAGWVVFEDADDQPTNPRDFAVRAIDAVDAIRPKIDGLTSASIACKGREVHLRPRWGVHGPPLVAVGDYLRELRTHDLDDAIDALVHSDKAVRQTARSLLVGQDPLQTTTGQIKVTVSATDRQTRGQLDVVQARAVVLLTASTLATLDPAQRSAAAGLAGLSLDALDGLRAAGLPVVIESHTQASKAYSRAFQIQARTGLPVEASAGGGVMRPLVASALLVTAVATAMGSLSLALLGAITFPAIGTFLTMGILSLAVWMLYTWNTDRQLFTFALQAASEAKEERQRQGSDPHLARAWTSLSDARAALAATSTMPNAAASDLRDVLKAAERELQSLATALKIVRRGLSSGTSKKVQARIDALGDGSTHAERRATLQQTLKEVVVLEEKSENIILDAHSLEAVLTAVSSSVLRWETEPEEEAMAAVMQATQSARHRRSLART